MLTKYEDCNPEDLQAVKDNRMPRVHRAMRFSFIYAFVMMFMMCFGLAGAQIAVTPAGSGTENDPYQITELGNLVWISDTVTSSSGKYYKMINDINALETSTWNSGAGFVPIGTNDAPFTGLFDGNGKKITGLTINRSSSNTDDFVGLFGYIGSSSTIKDLGLEDGSVSGTGTNTSSSSYVYVGGLVGYQYGGSITNCYASGNVSGTGTNTSSSSYVYVYVGGLVGYQNGGTITNCYATGEVIGTSSFSVHVGGLVGGHEGGSITNCYASGSVIGTGSSNVDVGGLVGYSGGTITNCYASGEVSGSSSSYVYVGGLVGRQNSGSITNCYATGAVSGGNFVGGLVGYHTTGTITNCYASGEVSGTTVGGLIGFSYYITITNCYATGRVTQISPGQYHGGLVGNNQGGTVNNSYYDSQTTGQSDTGKGMPKTTAEMKQQATFVGWNFDTVWMINEGLSYPYLFDTSKPQTKTVTEVPCTLTFKLSQTRNLTMDITGVAAGATITVQCLGADKFSAPNPPFKHAENLYKEKLVITGTGLEGLNATLTWTLDSGLYANGTAPDKVYRVSEGAIASEYDVIVSDETVTVSGVTGFSDWYAGESTAVPVTLSGLELE